MKIGILSDIHSNYEALSAVLQHASQQQPDMLVCLGDIIGYGANPNECIELIKSHCDIVILGNHDAALIQQDIAYSFTPHARAAILWTLSQITQANLQYLHTLPLTAHLDCCFFVHSAPTSPERWQYIIDENDATMHFSSFEEPLCFVGHSHIPGIYTPEGKVEYIHRGMKYIINSGSVGQPRDGNPKACYGILDTEQWTFIHIRLPYSVGTAAKKILEAGLPSALAYRLFEGR